MVGAVLQVSQRPYDHPEVQELVAAVQAEYVVRYGGPDETPLAADLFVLPGGAFLVGLLDGVPVAMGGWRLRSDINPWGCLHPAEVKRMYVAPAARRRGFATVILSRLEDSARASGADVMVLETGLRQPEAIRLYLERGYQPVDRFGFYADSPLSRYFGRRL